jgi:hypothetical protein
MSNVVVSKDEDPTLAEKLGRLVVREGEVLGVTVAQKNGGSDFTTLKPN